MKSLNVALVHDYLREYGGAERVLEALHEIFPEAPIYTAYLNLDGLGAHADRIKKWDIRTSWLQKMPFANRLLSPFRIFAPMIFEGFDLSEYDVVISSSSIYFSKAVITKPGSLHISYIHTPPRYLYGYTTSFNYKKNPVTRFFGEIANHFLRIYDFEISQRPDILVANSKNIQARIKKFYRRDSVVIYPSVDTNVILNEVKNLSRMRASNKLRDPSPQGYFSLRDGAAKPQDDKKYFLSVGRLVRGKGIDAIIEACSKLGLPLKVAGIGPELENLKSLIVNHKSSIEFLGQVKDEDLPGLYAGAMATIVASEDEDFGIVPVESMAAGTPVIAIKAGGFLETVIEGKTGEFFLGARQQATGHSLEEVLESFDYKKYKSEDCIKQAEKFSKERFKKEILELINKNINTK